MGRGRRWTEEENQIITEMYSEGCSVEEVAKRLPANRSVGAVQRQIGRLGLRRDSIVRTIEKNSVRTIEAEEAMSREEALNILSTAIKHLQKGGELKDVGFSLGVLVDYFLIYSCCLIQVLEELLLRLQVTCLV